MAKRSADLRYTDFIGVLSGANVPFILRKADDHFLLVSDVYVEGLMHGEAIDMMKRGDLVVETIDILMQSWDGFSSETEWEWFCLWTMSEPAEFGTTLRAFPVTNVCLRLQSINITDSKS